jgi:hypothetical protein
MERKYIYPQAKFANISKEWEIIPYVIMPQSELIKYARRLPDTVPSIVELVNGINQKDIRGAQIIHIARRINPDKNATANERLREWMWPLDARDIESTLIGDTSDVWDLWAQQNRMSLGAWSILDLRDKQGNQYAILATRYPIGKGAFMIQTPYSPGIDIPETRSSWEKYFSEIHSQAERDLVTTPWLSDDTRRFAPRLVRALSIIENMHEIYDKTLSYATLEIFFDTQLDRFWTLLGVNRWDAFRRKSSADAHWILQYTPKTYEWVINPLTGEKAPGIRDKYPHPAMPYDFSEMTRSHRGSLIAAYAHIEDQMWQYRNNYKNAYEWLMRVDPKYAIIILATGYNSGNSGRARELENIVVNNPSLQPAEIMERFYKWLWNSGAEETRGYIIKIEYILDKGLI